MILGAWGIPVGLVTGDDALAEEVGRLAAVGRARRGQDRGRWARAPPRSTRPSPPTGSGRAPSARSAPPRPAASSCLRVGPPVVIEVDYSRGVEADHAAIVPGAERFGDRGVRFASDDPVLAYRGFLAGDPAGQRHRSVTLRAASPRARPAVQPRRWTMTAEWPLDRLIGASGSARRCVGRSRPCLHDDRPGAGDPAPVRRDRPRRRGSAAGGRDRRSLADGDPRASATASRFRSRWPCSSTTSTRSSSRSTSRRARSTSRSRASSSASAIGALVAEAEAQRLATAAIERIDAQRTVRRETIGMLGEADRPWLGVTLREPDVEAASRRPPT